MKVKDWTGECPRCQGKLTVIENSGRKKNAPAAYHVCCNNDECPAFIGIGGWYNTEKEAIEAFKQLIRIDFDFEEFLDRLKIWHDEAKMLHKKDPDSQMHAIVNEVLDSVEELIYDCINFPEVEDGKDNL